MSRPGMAPTNEPASRAPEISQRSTVSCTCWSVRSGPTGPLVPRADRTLVAISSVPSVPESDEDVRIHQGAFDQHADPADNERPLDERVELSPGRIGEHVVGELPIRLLQTQWVHVALHLSVRRSRTG